MIICKRPAHPNEHLHKASPSGRSFAKDQPIRTTICKRPARPDDHLHGDKDNDIQVDGGPLEGKLLQTGSKTLKKVLADLKSRKKNRNQDNSHPARKNRNHSPNSVDGHESLMEVQCEETIKKQPKIKFRRKYKQTATRHSQGQQTCL